MKTITQVTRRYYKYIQQEQTWTHPNLSSNGTLGGTSFACGGTYSHTSYGTSNIYQLFDGNTGSGITAVAYNGGSYITFYNPEPIKVTSIKNDHIWYAGDWRDVTIYGSNDNSDWTNLGYFNHGLTTACDIANPQYFKYYKLYNNSGFGADGSGYGGGLTELYITASIMDTQIVESDSSDYDFYTDTKEIKCIKEIDRSYYKRLVTEFEQPVLSSNGTMGGNSFAVSGSGTAWYGFDSNEDSCLGQVGTLWFTFYTPEAINLTKLGIRNAGSTYLNFVSGGTIYGSDDNSTWTIIKSFSNSNTSYTWWYVDLGDNTKEFKYHKFVSSGSFGGNSNYLGGVRITGTHTDIVQVLNPQLIERKYYKYTSESVNINSPGVVTSSSGGGGWVIYSKTGYDEVYLMLNSSANPSYPRWQYSSPNVYAYLKTPKKCIITDYLTTQWCDDNTTGRICNHWIIYGYETEKDLLSLSNGTLIDDNTWASAVKNQSKTITLSNNKAFQYYSIQMVSNFAGSGYCSMGSTEFYAKLAENATAEDYDYYEDTYNYDFYKDKVYYYTNK